MGVTDEQIRALTFYQRSPLFDDREKAVILYADRVHDGRVDGLILAPEEGGVASGVLERCARVATSSTSTAHAPGARRAQRRRLE